MSDATRSNEPSLGEVHAGCRLERMLGRGGMGTVFLARRQDDARPVVVKFLDAEKAETPALRERLRREWEALGKVHPPPNVVRVFAVQALGVHPCMTMEYAPGTPLDVLIRPGPLTGERAARARALLPGVFGGDAGEDPIAWQRLLEQRRAGLPAQVLPRGWLTSVRSAR